MKKLLAIGIIICVCFCSILALGEANQPKETRYMICTATPATSALYSYYVGITKALMEAFPEYQFTVSEVTGAVDSTKRIRSGDVEIGNTMDNVVYESYKGIGGFKDDPNPNTRIMWYYNNTPLQIVVTKESGVKSLADLEGKRFNPGATGTGAATLTTGILKMFGINANLFAASQGDAADAMTSRQIIGVTKTGSIGDSYITQIGASIPINLISLSDDEINSIISEYPYLGITTIPAGTYVGVDYDVKTVFSACAVMSMKDTFTQQEAYEMLTTLYDDPEVRKEWLTAFPEGDVNVAELTLECIATPLHPGTVQYLKEKGHAVPEEYIPPEYVDP
jgi:TRAP transporter TAXI family solute receptor